MKPTASGLPDHVERALTNLWNLCLTAAPTTAFPQIELAYTNLRAEIMEAIAAASNDPDAPVRFINPGRPFVRHGVGNCECYFRCMENPATGCSLDGRWHVHAGDPCPVHPDAPGDH